jgi:hypothetical protein
MWSSSSPSTCRWTARAGYTYTTRENNERKTKIEWHDIGGEALLRLAPVLISASHQKPPNVRWTLRDSHVDLVLVPVWTMLVRYSPRRRASRCYAAPTARR